MVWQVTKDTRDVLTGDYAAIPAATAWYADHITVPSLPISGCDITSTLDGQQVRTQATLTVDDDEGRLVPYQGTDPLAPYGQQVTLRVALQAGTYVDQIPVGRFLIVSAAPHGSWGWAHGQWTPTGGDIELQLQDRLQDLIESEIPGLMQPKVGNTIAQEITRLCGGIVPVNTSGLPKDINAIARGVVYDQNRLTAISQILAGSSGYARASRAGILEFFTLPTVVSKQVTADAGEWVQAAMSFDRDGLYNTVVCTSDQADDRVSGMAQETSGAFSASGPLHPRIYRQSSPLYLSNARAKAGAQTLLTQQMASRSLPVEVTCPLDPTVDVGDLHRVSLVPGSLEPNGRVTSMKWSPFKADMTVTYSIPRAEVEAWIRTTSLQPS